MNPNEYVKNVLVTEARDFTPVQQRLMEIQNIRLLHACAGISSELSELIEIEKKFEGDDKIDRVNIMEELGDILWYIGIASDALDAVNEITTDPEFVGKKTDFDGDLCDDLIRFSLNVSAIAGELVDKAVKKTIFYGKKVDKQDLIDKLRLIHQNVKYMLEHTGYTLEDARERNIAKLKARYGEKFTEAAALERNLAAERAILESKS